MTGFAFVVAVSISLVAEPTVEDDWRAADFPPALRTSLVERSKRAPFESIAPVILKVIDHGPWAYGSSFSDEPWNDENLSARDRKYWMALAVWDHHFEGSDRNDRAKAKFLVTRLQKASGKTEKLYLISTLQHYHWCLEAQETLLKTARNPAEEFEVRNRAAQTLMRKVDPNVHVQSALTVALSYGDLPRRCEAFNDIFNLGNRLWTLSPENQRAFVVAGFELLGELPEEDMNVGYFVALRMNFILKIKVEFQPDRKNGKYDDRGNLSEAFFADTTRNALKWYAEHRAEVQAAERFKAEPLRD